MRKFDERARRIAASALFLAVGGVGVGACSDVVGGVRGEDGETEEVPRTEELTSIAEIDLLLVIDGSGSMADKQAFLAQSIRPFLERLRSPRCVDGARDPIEPQPASSAEACPEGSIREFAADLTVHLGVISSSLGTGLCDVTNEGRFDDDAARLLSRDLDGNAVPTPSGLGVFSWDPAEREAPAGDADFETFATGVEAVIRGVGERGCGFEAPLEAMYRFLAEPSPAAPAPEGEEPEGLDDVLLGQRAAFLRPTSVLSVIVLSDENDCSMVPVLGDFLGRGDTFPPRPRDECASNPNDACCASCIEAVPAGCSGDGGCAAPGDLQNPGNYFDPSVDLVESSPQLRCWDPKRRFGLEALHDVERYVSALSDETLTLEEGNTAPNPVFVGGRLPAQVLYTVVSGVPWQDVAQDPTDITSGFQSPAELVDRGTWSVILGDPDANVPPTDPLMIESVDPRTGTIPATGESLPGMNGVNGGERPTVDEDLQYACIFDLPIEMQRECDLDENNLCDCYQGDEENPVCQTIGPDRFRQIRAKVYPGLRQLDVARRLGSQGRVVPLCAPLTLEGLPDPGTLGAMGLAIGLEELADQMARTAPPEEP